MRRTILDEPMTEKQRAAQEDGHEAVAGSSISHLPSTAVDESRQAGGTDSGDGRARPHDIPRLTALVPIDADRRVAHVEVGPFRIGSLWLVGCESGRPTVSWPRTTRGYPIIEVTDPLRSEIEALVLDAERDETPRLRKPRKAVAGPRRPKTKPSGPVVDPDLNDPLDDLLQ